MWILAENCMIINKLAAVNTEAEKSFNFHFDFIGMWEGPEMKTIQKHISHQKKGVLLCFCKQWSEILLKKTGKGKGRLARSNDKIC